jgi:hypothetical protein
MKEITLGRKVMCVNTVTKPWFIWTFKHMNDLTLIRKKVIYQSLYRRQSTHRRVCIKYIDLKVGAVAQVFKAPAKKS